MTDSKSTQEQPAQKQSKHPRLKALGQRFSDSVMFGAGATLGSDMMNGLIDKFKK